MPYSGPEDKGLPSYVKKLSKDTKRKWVAIFNHFYTESEDKAFSMANSWLKKHLAKKKETKLVKRSIVKFVVSDSSIIVRSDNGEEYITAMLQDVYGDTDGLKWTPEALQDFANQINSGEQIIGDIDHEEYDRIVQGALSDEEVIKKFQSKKGIAKTVKAALENGRLWIRTSFDKRYKKQIEKSKGLSIEALVTKDDRGRVTGGKILGWSFIINDTPANPRTAGIYS